MTHGARWRVMSVRGAVLIALPFLLLSGVGVSHAEAQDESNSSGDSGPNIDILTQSQWAEIDASVDRGLDFLARNQQRDGSFAGPEGGQPGITALAVMAFLSRGHVPGSGRYGDDLERAIDYVLTVQQRDGLLSVNTVSRHVRGRPNYNHAIAGVMLGEVYGMTAGELNERIRHSIVQALRFSRSVQTRRKRHPRDKGGWRYLAISGPNDSDLTATAWHLMFYRSARNAEFEVPGEYIDDAMGYVERCYLESEGGFLYGLKPNYHEYYASGGTVGAGIVALAMGGQHQTEMAQAAGRWILRHPFSNYNRREQPDDRYHYSAYVCSQAMFQLGGEYWERFYPEFQRVLLANQNGDGSWDRESAHDGRYGNAYTTALVVLALTPPYQLLPIYQR